MREGAVGESLDVRLDGALRHGPFAVALRLSRRRARLTLEAVVDRVQRRGHQLSVSTLSAWERGQFQPERTASLEALQCLESVYGHPPRALVRLVGPPRRPRSRGVGRPGSDRAPVFRRSSSRKALEELLDRAGPRPEQAVLDLHEFHEVGDDGCPWRHRTRQVVQALAEGIGRDLYVFDLGASEGLDVVSVHGRHNCRVGRQWTDEEHGLVVVELLFDRILQPGQTHLFEYETIFDYPSRPRPEFRRRTSAQLEHLLVQVTFSPDHLPARIWRSRWDQLDATPVHLEQLVPDRSSSVHFVTVAPAPGQILGIRWEW